MLAHDPVMELLLRWDELRRQGREVTAEELCRDCPEQADLLRQHIAAVRAVDELLQTCDEGADTDTPPPWQGPHVDGYEILGELGRGGAGVVYRARQLALNRVVAVKMLLVGAHAGEEDLARFRREAETLAQMQHPGIVQIHELGNAAGHAYLALEYVEGGSLADRLGKGPLPPAEAARLVAVAARAVEAAHRHGIVHRDLKPGNVLLTADGQPKVSDFGLAKRVETGPVHTPTGAVVGTPSYMAPEQASGKAGAVGPAADVYALGAILYEALAGRPPFRTGNLLDTLYLVMSAEPTRPSRLRPGVPRIVERICLKCLEKRPERRYVTAAALADDLERWLRNERVIFGGEGRLRRLWWAVERRRRIIATAVLVSAAAGGVFLLAPPPTERGGPEAGAVTKVAAPLLAKDGAAADDPSPALVKELAAGQRVTLLGETGPPRWRRWLLNGGGSTERPADDGSFALSSVAISLLELVPDPTRTAYRFSAEVRHDYNPNDGEIGLFFGLQDHAKPGERQKLTFYTFHFSDRGGSARIIRGPGGETLSALEWNFREFASLPGGSPLSNRRLAVKPFQPALTFGRPGPWRKLLAEVTPTKIGLSWAPDPGRPPSRVGELTRQQLHQKVLDLQRQRASLQGLELAFVPRTALGLYVLNSTASFRRVVLEPFEGR